MTHPRVHVRLGALDVVVQVVSEQLDVRDRRRGGLRGEVAGEQDWWKGGEKKERGEDDMSPAR